MLSKHPLRQFSLHVILFAIPLFFIWWWLFDFLISPLLTVPANQLLAWVYGVEQMRVEAHMDGLWDLHSRIMMEHQPNDPTKVYVTSQNLESNRNLTLGLPVLWAFLAAFSASFRLQALATLLLLVPISLSVSLDAVHDAAQLLIKSQGEQVFVDTNTVQTVEQLPETWLSILKNLNKLLSYFNLLLFPVLITGLFYRQKMQQLIIGSQQQASQF